MTNIRLPFSHLTPCLNPFGVVSFEDFPQLAVAQVEELDEKIYGLVRGIVGFRRQPTYELGGKMDATRKAGSWGKTIAFLVAAILICYVWYNRVPPPTSIAPIAPADAVSSADPTNFRVIAESEVKTLQDAGILNDFTKETGIKLTINYRGPVDIRNAVSNLGKNNPKQVDAYWPGSSLWLPGSSTVQPESVMKTYVVLAVDPATARELGWEPAKGITASDLVSAIQSGKINLAMTSASQSTPGAAFYLAMYTALTGKRVLTSNELNNPQATQDIKTMLAGVDRSAQSLDHLEQVFVDDKAS